jgi:hypothetical protein
MSSIQLHGSITSHLRQGKKITKLARLDDTATLWRHVVEQLSHQDLALATRLDPPRLRTVEPRPQHARAAGEPRPAC